MTPPLRDLFDSDGFLVPGPELYRTDEITIHAPWGVSLSDVRDVMAHDGRGEVMNHLEGWCRWWFRAVRRDPAAELWVAGDFGCSLRPDVGDLEIYALFDPLKIDHGDRWLLRVLTSAPVELHPGRLAVRQVRPPDPDGGNYDRDQASRRASTSVHDPVTGSAYITGWLSILKEDSDG